MSTKKQTILIIEDDTPERNVLRDKLRHEGFLTLEAKDGVEGLETALCERPDMILLDLAMPKMDGVTMLRKLRSENAWGKTAKVIVLTNLPSADEQRNRDITELEPHYYLVKADMTLQDVVSKIREDLGVSDR
jgi:CheY-like chemotaxis protein